MPSEDAKPVKKEKLKKGEKKEDEEEEKSLSSIHQARKKNPTNAGTLITKPRPKDAKVKKEEPQDDEFDKPIKGKALSSSGSGSKISKAKKEDNGDAGDHKPISKNNSAARPDKELNKKKKKAEEQKKGSVAAKQNGKKKERKAYDLPGQKRDPPEDRDPLRIFYGTLYEQLPNSEMAQFWMMESGLLSLEEAKKVYEKKQKKGHLKLLSPAKVVITPKKTRPLSDKKKTSSSSVPSTKKKMTDSKIAPKQSKKRNAEDESSEDDSDNDFQVNKAKKKHRAS